MSCQYVAVPICLSILKQYGTRIDLMRCLWWTRRMKMVLKIFVLLVMIIQRLLECERQGIPYTEKPNTN